MGTDSFDIWTLWNQTAALILKAGQPTRDNRATVYIMPSEDMSEEELMKAIQCER